MEERAVRGVRWTLLAYASNKLVSVAATLVLARLLVPEDFGLVALATLAITVLNLTNDLGMWGALVLRQDFDARAQGTVLSIMLGTRAGGTLLVAGLSPVAAAVFGEPRLTGVLAALSVTVLIGGVTWFYDALLQRELEFRRRFLAQGAQTVAYVAVVIPLAVAGAGVWSIVAGQIGGILAQTAAAVGLAPYRVRPAFDRSSAREALSSGRGFIVQGVVAFLKENTDYLAVGRVLGARDLGLYSMGYRLSDLPWRALAEPVAEVTFPGFARMRHRGEDPRPPFITALSVVALTACPLGLLLSATAEPFTRALLGEKWLGMIGALYVLGMLAFVRPVEITIGWLLNSVGEARIMGRLAAILFALLIPAAFVAASKGGIEAVAWVMLGESLASLAALCFVSARRAGVTGPMMWRGLRPVLLASPPCWIAARLTAAALDAAPAAAALVASSAAGLAAYAAAAALADPEILRVAFRQIRRLGRRPAEAGA